MLLLYEHQAFPQTLYTGSSQFISGVSIWLQAKAVKPKSKPKVGSISIEMHEFSSYTFALAHERQHGETQTKNPIRSPFHQLKRNHMAVYLHISIQRSGRFALFEHCSWSDTQRLCIYKLLRSHTASGHLIISLAHM